ncbi:hypothetical protein M8C21_015233 [Ambrosia artemisiifolia]|uniref:Cytochrome P450 n=1 Tax=Ambrosia artemisiifolia TaxID=4212 RepID=A0AAD5C2G1_AMBAR|nr:hypothetical protein M8C21_015233 [Ambrosia artemisiifolia]
MINKMKAPSSTKQLVDLSEAVMVLTSNIISRVAFGKRPSDYNYRKEGTRLSELMLECQEVFGHFYYRDHFPLMGWLDKLNGSIARLEKIYKDMDEFYQEVIDEHLNQNQPNKMEDDMVDILLKLKQDYANDLTFDHVKGVFMNILLGGTETSASTVIWAMTLLINNPKSLKKLKQEVRNAVGNKGKVEEDDLYKLDYLKAVVKEALRLYPVLPLLLPRESRERCVLGGYDIPKNTLVYLNAWAVGRDPKCWERPEEFEPERFMGSSNVDYKGVDFEWIPFGSGRRGCPGLLLGATTVELALSNIVYSFDWEMPEGTNDIDFVKTEGTVMHKKNALQLFRMMDAKSSLHLLSEGKFDLYTLLLVLYCYKKPLTTSHAIRCLNGSNVRLLTDWCFFLIKRRCYTISRSKSCGQRLGVNLKEQSCGQRLGVNIKEQIMWSKIRSQSQGANHVKVFKKETHLENLQEMLINLIHRLELTKKRLLSFLISDPNILLGGTETIINNPKSLKKLKQEVRNVVGNKGKVEEDDLYKLDYLKAVVKEALRLYPVLPLLLPSESRERCILGVYEIPKNTLVYLNAWAVGRDPKCWERPKEFEPERFMGSSNIDYKGVDFEWIPFGSGRRGCPGLLLGATTVELALSNIKIPEGTNDTDFVKTEGTVMHKKNALQLVAKVPDNGC